LRLGHEHIQRHNGVHFPLLPIFSCLPLFPETDVSNRFGRLVELTVFLIDVETSVNITKNLVAFTIDELLIQIDKVKQRPHNKYLSGKKELQKRKPPRDLSEECNNRIEHKGKLSEVRASNLVSVKECDC